MTNIEDFPDVSLASEEGLLALGGDLSPERLLSAYSKGIFPWYNPGEPILWWSPDPRCVLIPQQFKASRSLKKSIRKQGFEFAMDRDFEQVITQCAQPRIHQPGTWITQEMKQAYVELHKLGHAHSMETWMDGQLVGGLYGIAIGGMFFGESMFSLVNDASKAALSNLISKLLLWQFQLIDCQITSTHLLSLGAQEIPRTEFMKKLEWAMSQPGKTGCWQDVTF